MDAGVIEEAAWGGHRGGGVGVIKVFEKKLIFFLNCFY